MPRIVIVVHRHFSLERMNYFMGEMADMWRSDGLEVVVQRGPSSEVSGDVAVQHVDLTVPPADHMEYVRRFPVAINGKVADISKRRISADLVVSGDGYSGPVIVKSNRNHGGFSEAQLAVRGLMPSRFARVIKDYRIFDSSDQVPRVIWGNPDVVVERFLPERREGMFCLRVWMFLGDKETHGVCYSNEPIVKSANIVRREPGGEVPQELRRMREQLGFDFGKFDYAFVEGRVVLYDANPTPTLGNFAREQMIPRVRILADGIKSFL